MISACPPAQLWIGSTKALLQRVETYLQKQLCFQQGCQQCTDCREIQSKQHHACLWLNPQTTWYTLEQLQPFFNTINKALAPNQQFFFIFNAADYLSPACANRLLKSVEEPPPGYHMIFLAQQLKSIVPTLRSRCFIWQYDTLAEQSNSVLTPFFTGEHHDIEAFLQTVDTMTLDERTTQQILQQIVSYWLGEYKKKCTTVEGEDILAIIQSLQTAQERLPMPGSAKLFWKNLYLQMHQ